MHLALGLNIPCIAFFTCTSPWEIYDYGLLKKFISPLLEEFFYRRDYERRGTEAIKLEPVLEAIEELVPGVSMPSEKGC